MKYSNLSIFILAAVSFITCGCKIQDVSGPYQPAKSKITIEELEAAEETRDDVIPMPGEVFRENELANDNASVDVVAEPVRPEPIVVEPDPVIEEKSADSKVTITTTETKVAVTPEPKVTVATEIEQTRAESFVVVDDEQKIELKTYHVVIGSFGNKNNALRLQAKMRPQYNPILVLNDKGMFRVLLISYDTYKEAKTKINEIKGQFFDAWVLVQKK